MGFIDWLNHKIELSKEKQRKKEAALLQKIESAREKQRMKDELIKRRIEATSKNIFYCAGCGKKGAEVEGIIPLCSKECGAIVIKELILMKELLHFISPRDSWGHRDLNLYCIYCGSKLRSIGGSFIPDKYCPECGGYNKYQERWR
jgi:hypothetical protein